MSLNRESGSIRPAPPFDFGKSLRFLENFGPTRGDESLSGGAFTSATRLGDRVVVCRVEGSGTVEEPRLEYTLWSDAALGPGLAAAARDRVAFRLSASDDLRPFYALGRRDPAFAPVIERLYGYHQVKFPTPFEAACWALLSQRTSMGVALVWKRRLMDRYGGGLTVDGRLYGAFPQPARLAAAHPEELAALAGGEQRAERLASVAAGFELADERWLLTAPYEEAAAWLRSLPGIGEWSASFVLLRGLGRVERFPSGERRLLEAASRVYGRAVGPAELDELGARYGPWRGHWAHYLRAASMVAPVAPAEEREPR